MGYKALIMGKGQTEEGDGSESCAARLRRQLNVLSVQDIHEIPGKAGAGECHELLRNILLSVRTGVRFLVMESGVVADMQILKDILASPDHDALLLARPLESVFSKIGTEGEDVEPPSLEDGSGARHLLMGTYLLSDHEFRNMIPRLEGASSSTIGRMVESYLIERHSQFRSIEVGNSELQNKPVQTPAMWEQVPRMLEFNERTVTKRATTGREKLRAEVRWLRRLPPQARELFPEVLDAQLEGDAVSYTMPLYPMKNLEETAHRPGADVDQLKDGIISMFSLLAEHLYRGREAEPLPGYIRFNHLHKIRERMAAACSMSPLFERYASAASLIVNGKKRPGLPQFLAALEHDIPFLAQMEPPRVFLVHGDLKPDNILIDEAGARLRFVDPRGASPAGMGLDDTAVDAAKLLSTIQGYHHAFKNGRMQVDLFSREERLHIRTNFIRDATRDQHIAAECGEAIRRVSEIPFFTSDAQWLPRAKLLTALVQVAFAPYHLIATQGLEEKTAVGLLARGLEMLEEEYPPGIRSVHRGRFCNDRFPCDHPLIRQLLAEP